MSDHRIFRRPVADSDRVRERPRTSFLAAEAALPRVPPAGVAPPPPPAPEKIPTTLERDAADLFTI